MIDKSEIMEFSREFGLRANVIEKDYVLGWVLAGIFNHAKIVAEWVFKGGTRNNGGRWKVCKVITFHHPSGRTACDSGGLPLLYNIVNPWHGFHG